MRVLLVKPDPPKACINLQSFMICEPLELEYCAALLDTLGCCSDIVDLVIDHNFKHALDAADYDVVAFTAYQIHIGVVKGYAEEVKRKNPRIFTLVGGVEAEVVPESFEHPAIDVVLQGGLPSLKAVVQGIMAGVSLDELKILGRNRYRESLGDILPDRSKTARYREHYNYIYHDRCATIKTSFGCQFDCEFCFCTRVCSYGERSLEHVIEELRGIEEENVFIVDDNFLSRRERLHQFADLIEKAGIMKTYIAFGRADFIAANEDVIERLARIGFDAFFVGIESYKANELNDYNKRTDVETNQAAVRILEKHGLQCYSGLIVGYDWKPKDFDGLIDYLNGFAHPMVNIQPITPIKGTPFYEKNKQNLTVNEDKYAYFDMAHAVMKPQYMSTRRFYFHILRAYLKTSANKNGRRYIRERYGRRVYKRVRHGAFKIAMQYIRLMIKP